MSPPGVRNGRPQPGNARSKMFRHHATHRPQCAPRDAFRQARPETFGLTPLELWHEAARLVCDWGWSLEEVRQVLDLPESVTR